MAIRKNRLAHQQILESEAFCINVLPKESVDLIRQFKIADWKTKFDSLNYKLSSNGLPVLDDCIGYLDFSLESSIDAGDHTLFIGRIKAGATMKAAEAAALSTANYRGVYRGSQ
jgi:flavin reductase (DIM6/NTAB) family NADH-FMN oxidoreductase RutF